MRQVQEPPIAIPSVPRVKKTVPRFLDLAYNRGRKRPAWADLHTKLREHDFFYMESGDGSIVRLIGAGNSHSLLEAVLDAAAELEYRCQAIDRATGKTLDSVDKARETLSDTSLLRLYLTHFNEDRLKLEILFEEWSYDEMGSLKGSRNNKWISKIWAGNPILNAPRRGGLSLEEGLPAHTPDQVTFDVDYVFSWVNADDPDWQQLIAPYRPVQETDASSDSRFRARSDLMFALRSIERFAPWVRNVYVLSNCAPPEWLDLDQEGIIWVDHSEVFDADALPTFSSHAIETVIHRIPGLAEHFIYSNDDFYLMRSSRKEDFFLSSGAPRARLEAYGMVNGPVQSGQPDYLNGARNSAERIVEGFGLYPTRLHTHSPQSLRKSILEEMESRYSEDFARTQRNKFRNDTDVAVTGFFFAHYAFVTGRGQLADTPTRLVQQNHDFESILGQIRQQVAKTGSSKYLSVCINDGNGSHLNESWDRVTEEFLSSVFPGRSRFEK